MTIAMGRKNDLFENPAFLSWLPGETLFSLVSRHHYFWGQALSSRTCEQFFDHPRAGAQHDIPSRLTSFVASTGGCFGSVKQIATTRTLLSFYAAFISEEELDNAVTCMAGDSVAHLKFRLGILTSRFRANHPLKACEVCMQDDRTTCGWAYWHMDHQYPGVWTCVKHNQQLRESTLKSTGVERFQWHLPDENLFRKWPAETRSAIQAARAQFESLSSLVSELVTQASVRPIDTGRLHEVYRAELERRQWVSSGGNFRMPMIASSFLGYVQNLRILPELEAFSATTDEAITQLGRLLRPPRSGTHPLRHLVLINWLFDSADAFWHAYSSTLNPIIGESKDVVFTAEEPEVVRDLRHEQLVDLLTIEKRSVRMAAKAIGIDVGTAMAWAAKAGLSVRRRPKKLAGEVRERALVELKNGAEKTLVAKNANVSVVTITKLLLSEVGLHAAWCQARERQVQAAARGVWTHLLHSHPGLGVKLMRAMEPATYAWLYRNDRAWLENHKPDRQAVEAVPGTPRVLWDARDQALSVEVDRAVLELRKQLGARQLKLWQIFQAVPALKAKLAALDRLPLTRRVVDRALQRKGGTMPDMFG